MPFSLNAAVIAGMLQREGAVTELHPYAGAKHGFIGSDARNTTARKESLGRTVAFFERHL